MFFNIKPLNCFRNNSNEHTIINIVAFIHIKLSKTRRVSKSHCNKTF